SLEFCASISELDEEIDIAIVATKADVRKNVIEILLTLKHVRYMILEKVLFQDLESYKPVHTLLKTRGVRTWVNCPIRTNPFFQQLKYSLKPGETIHYDVCGGNLGIGCNSIHHIDLLSFLTGETKFTFTTKQLDDS